MKNTLTTFAMILAFSTGASAQNPMTNSVQGEIKILATKHFADSLDDISKAFNVLICSEDNMSSYFRSATGGTPHLYQYEDEDWKVFSNATFGEVLGYQMRGATNHTWRYESRTDTIYVYPTTNSFTMTRHDRITVTNMTVKAFFDEQDVLGLKACGIYLGGKQHIMMDAKLEKISLDLTDVFVWEILDAITAQLSVATKWSLAEDLSRTFSGYRLGFD